MRYHTAGIIIALVKFYKNPKGWSWTNPESLNQVVRSKLQVEVDFVKEFQDSGRKSYSTGKYDVQFAFNINHPEKTNFEFCEVARFAFKDTCRARLQFSDFRINNDGSALLSFSHLQCFAHSYSGEQSIELNITNRADFSGSFKTSTNSGNFNGQFSMSNGKIDYLTMESYGPASVAKDDYTIARLTSTCRNFEYKSV